MIIRDALRGASEEAIREVQRQAEVCLDGTVQLAIASDQRATTLAGISTAAAIALAAAGIASAAGRPQPEAPVSFLEPLANGAISAAVVLFIAALVFIYSARPVDFYLAGYEPRGLSRASSDMRWVMIYAIEDLQRRIDENRSVLDRAARPFFWGCALAVSAVPLGFLVYWFSWLASRPF